MTFSLEDCSGQGEFMFLAADCPEGQVWAGMSQGPQGLPPSAGVMLEMGQGAETAGGGMSEIK